MPSLGADMEAATLVKWRVEPGTRIARGDIVAEVDTDKGVIEIECFEPGIVEELLAQPGEKVPVGSVMALAGPGAPAGVYLLTDALKTDDAYWAFVGVLLLALPGVPISFWCLSTLRKPAVRAGFAEEKPEDFHQG